MVQQETASQIIKILLIITILQNKLRNHHNETIQNNYQLPDRRWFPASIQWHNLWTGVSTYNCWIQKQHPGIPDWIRRYNESTWLDTRRMNHNKVYPVTAITLFLGKWIRIDALHFLVLHLSRHQPILQGKMTLASCWLLRFQPSQNFNLARSACRCKNNDNNHYNWYNTKIVWLGNFIIKIDNVLLGGGRSGLDPCQLRHTKHAFFPPLAIWNEG